MKDLDFERDQIAVRQGKGRKDRVTMLPATAKEPLLAHLEDVRRVHAGDLANGLGRVALPYGSERKSPGAATDWRWQFVFPAGRVCRDSRFGSRHGITCTNRSCRRQSRGRRMQRV